MFSTGVFHLSLKSPRFGNKTSYSERRTLNFDKVLKFCKSVQLYQVAVVFTTCKLLINIALIYIPLFINETAIDESGTIASIPLVAYVSSLVTSMGVEYVKPCLRSDKVSPTSMSVVSAYNGPGPNVQIKVVGRALKIITGVKCVWWLI